MKRFAFPAALLFAMQPLSAQRPSDPALLVPQEAPVLEYVSLPTGLAIPEDVKTGPSASVTFDKSGNLWVLYRGPQPVMEFDTSGKLLQSFGAGLFTRTH